MKPKLTIFVPLLLLASCVESKCPTGTYQLESRCLPLSDTPDASRVEGDTDTLLEGDACTPQNYYRDSDEDGHGDPESVMSACTAPEGYVETYDDCNDDCPTCFLDAAELCDGIDQDCDGSIDEELTDIVSYIDFDDDGYGDSSTMQSSCTIPEGRVTMAGDCDDRSPSTHPGAEETCNLVDDDCDDQIDEGVLIPIYRDADGDGIGVQSNSRQACDAYAGFSRVFGDCNDEPSLQGARAYPGAHETCDDIDNDCDGSVDEDVRTRYYVDCDRDGYAASTVGNTFGCGPEAPSPASCPGGGWTTRAPDTGNIDCLDTDATTFPGNTAWYRTTRSNGTSTSWDHNCDGQSEQSNTRIQILNCGLLREACIIPSGWRDNVPACGQTGTFLSCDAGCRNRLETRVQECR